METKRVCILLRLPKSLHEALAIRAKAERISLNKLVCRLLSIPLRERLGLSKGEKAAWRSVARGSRAFLDRGTIYKRIPVDES